MTVQVVFLLGCLGCLLALAGLAVLAFRERDEPPLFVYAVAVVLVVAALFLFTAAVDPSVTVSH